MFARPSAPAHVNTGFPGHNGPAWQQHSQGPWPQVVYGAPPLHPNAVVVRPGDPRIGGQLCMKCGGSGVTFGFLFDEDQCSRCRGSGRVF